MQIKEEKIPSVKIPCDLSQDSVESYENNLELALKVKPKTINIDCSGLTQVTSSHINLLWLSYQLCRDKSSSIILDSPTLNLVRVLTILDLLQVFNLEELNETSLEYSKKLHLNQPQGDFNIEFESNSDCINSTIENLLIFLGEKNLSSLCIFEIKVLVYEVLTNIRLHSLAENKMVNLSVTFNKKSIVFNISDSGREFNPTSAKVDNDFTLAVKNRKKRGFGLNLINKLTNQMSYQRTKDNKNLLRLEKRWG